MVGANNGLWSNSNELISQIRDIRNTAVNPGHVFYSASIFDKLHPHVSDSVSKSNMYYAFPPVMKWLNTSAPASPIVKAIPSSQGTLIQWHMPQPPKERITYAVYRFINDEPINIERSDKIIRVLSASEMLDETANKYRKCSYVVTAFDRLWNESKPGAAAETRIDK
jgi:hypothetical protein